MEAEFIPTQEQLKACLQQIKKNITQREEKKAENERLIKITEHWDYGRNPDINKKSQLGGGTIYPRLDSNLFKKELQYIIQTCDKNDENYKTALHLSCVIRNINFWLLKGVTLVDSYTHKIFYNHNNVGDIGLSSQQRIAGFNLTEAIGQNWGVITTRLYGCKVCVYYGQYKYSSWIKLSDREAFAESFYCSREYRMSFAPAILVNICNSGLWMVLSGSRNIDNKKHIGYGYCNLIKKKRKRKALAVIDGHSMIHILEQNKHEVHVEFYEFNNAAPIKITLESNAKNSKPVVLFPKLPPLPPHLQLKTKINSHQINNALLSVHPEADTNLLGVPNQTKQNNNSSDYEEKELTVPEIWENESIGYGHHSTFDSWDTESVGMGYQPFHSGTNFDNSFPPYDPMGASVSTFMNSVNNSGNI